MKMFLEDLNQNVSLLGFRRIIHTSNRWWHVDSAIEIQGNCIGDVPTQDLTGIQIWEDVWQTRNAQILHFLSGLTKPLKSIFARDTRIVPISAEVARVFLDANHLMGFSKGSIYLGCVVPPHRQFRGMTSEYKWEGNPLLAVAVFGKPMVMKEEGMAGDLSGELIKLATVPGIRLVGGITKFLEAYRLFHPVDNIMTYIDLDWNLGKGFMAIGFNVVAQTPPLLFKVENAKRVAVSEMEEADVWTRGNLKLRYTYGQ